MAFVRRAVCKDAARTRDISVRREEVGGVC